MTTIYCDICLPNYTRSAWYKHTGSRKHINNLNEQNRIVREREQQQINTNRQTFRLVLQQFQQELERRKLIRSYYYDDDIPINLPPVLIPTPYIKPPPIKKSKRAMYEKILSSILFGERKIRNTEQVFPDDNLFDLPDIRIETHNGPAFHQVILHYVDDNLTNGVENYFNTLRFTIRNQIRKYFENDLEINIRLVCTFEAQYGFFDRIIFYIRPIRVVDLGGIDRFTNHLIE